MALKDKTSDSWRQTEGGYEVADSIDLIKHTLLRLQEKRTFVVLLRRGYQSGNTYVIGNNDETLQIVRPYDWPMDGGRMRLVFKDETNVWNHFNTEVTGLGKDTVSLRMPLELYRLQRRSHYRVSTPSGTLATFTRKGQVYKNFHVQDIGVGGISLCGENEGPDAAAIPLNAEVGEIAVSFPIPKALRKKGGPAFHTIPVAKGILVRSYLGGGKKIGCLGIRFLFTPEEENELLYYVRQRELEIIRSGVLG